MAGTSLLDQAAEMGRAAGRIGDPVTACPYSMQDTPSERELARVWVSGYLSVRPPLAIDYDDSPAVDAD